MPMHYGYVDPSELGVSPGDEVVVPAGTTLYALDPDHPPTMTLRVEVTVTVTGLDPGECVYIDDMTPDDWSLATINTGMSRDEIEHLDNGWGYIPVRHPRILWTHDDSPVACDVNCVEVTNLAKPTGPAFLTVAHEFLVEAGMPLHYRELAKRMLDSGRWASKGKTPAATLSAAIGREIREGGDRFIRLGGGKYAANDTTQMA